MWKSLPKPFLALAPMDDVTDVVFRQIIAEEGKPDVFFTEFVNVEALCSPGREVHGRRLEFTEDQRLIVAQIWGREPEHFRKVSAELVSMGFDGIDINMGCPDRTVLKNGLCSALIEDHARAAEIIAAAKEGIEEGEHVTLRYSQPSRVIPSAPSLSRGVSRDQAGLATQGDTSIPLSVKTRIGIRKPVTEDWIGFLLEQNLDAITIHARTVKDMSKVPARWEEIAKAVNIRDAMKSETVIIGNGDVVSRKQAIAYTKEYGVDGVMIGRGIFQNLWLFHPEKCDQSIPLKEKLRVLRRHSELYHDTWGDTRSFEILKKFIKVYVAGFSGAAEMRRKLMECKDAQDLLCCCESVAHSSTGTGIPTN